MDKTPCPRAKCLDRKWEYTKAEQTTVDYLRERMKQYQKMVKAEARKGVA